MLSGIIRFIGRRTFWKLTKSEKEHLRKEYERDLNLSGDKEFAEKAALTEKELILARKEERFYSSLSSFFE